MKRRFKESNSSLLVIYPSGEEFDTGDKFEKVSNLDSFFQDWYFDWNNSYFTGIKGYIDYSSKTAIINLYVYEPGDSSVGIYSGDIEYTVIISNISNPMGLATDFRSFIGFGNSRQKNNHEGFIFTEDSVIKLPNNKGIYFNYYGAYEDY